MAITLESISKLPTSRKVLILGLLVALLVGLYVYLIYWPNQELLKRKKAEMVALEGQVRELRIIEANMKRFREEAEKLRRARGEKVYEHEAEELATSQARYFAKFFREMHRGE